MRLKHLTAGLLFVALLLLVAGCGGTTAKKDATLQYGKNAAQDENGNAKNEDKYRKYQEEQGLSTPSTTVAAAEDKVPAGKKQYAVIETNKGKIVFELYPDVAPNTVASFVKLANEGYFNGIKWHRVVPGFVIQGGDPNSKDDNPANDGQGGPGYNINAEFNARKHLVGTVAMARSEGDFNSAGSQFYICLEPQPTLDGQYTVFGQVTEGMDVVQNIAQYDVMNKVSIITK